VLCVADLKASTGTRRTRHIIDGIEEHRFSALAITKYLDDPGVYLLYCDDDWNAVTDIYHDSIEHAIAQASFEFGPLDFHKTKKG
jgi:hypothetical protein